MTQKERMLAGLPYKAWQDGVREERMEGQKRVYRYNNLPPDCKEEADQLIREIFGKCGDGIDVNTPFHCDFGRNIRVGNNFSANFNCVILDVGPVVIGDNVMLAPNASIFTAGHPVHPDSRNSGYEYGISVTIGSNVWIGGNAVINPGVTIGDNVVIGSGSVVTKDIPGNCIAVGNPCRVVREITDEDRKYYFKDRVFDVDDYNDGVYDVRDF